MKLYKLLKNWKQDPRNMVLMIRPTTNITKVGVVFVNVDGNKADLTGTEMVLLAGKYGREYNDKKITNSIIWGTTFPAVHKRWIRPRE